MFGVNPWVKVMDLRILPSEGAWRVVAALDDHGGCPFEDELCRLINDAKTQAYASGFKALWDRIPRQGPKALSTDLYHRVDEENQIYEFIKGPYRVLCFELDGAVVVCSHLLRKRRQNIRRKDKNPAIELRNRCIEASKRGELKFIDD